MSTITISGTVNSTDPEQHIGAEVWVDDHCILDLDHVTGATPWTHDIDTQALGMHELRFVMKNKQAKHTKIDADGNVVKDVSIVFADTRIDELEIGAILRKLSSYTHNFNGHGETVTDRFYGSMGCNGTVTMAFELPINIWYLENR